MGTEKSDDLFRRAQGLLVGGVNSPVRAFKAVGGAPRFIEKAEGPRIVDADGNTFIDYVCSWGPMILGHADARVVEAVSARIRKGTSFGAPTELEIELAEMIMDAFPSMERIRMVSSGTEATMSAIRLARGATGRDRIVKFEGCYHGHSDSLLVKAGSGALTHGVPDSPGVPASLAGNTIVAPYNDLEAVEEIVEAEVGQIACLIVEPVAGNMGVIPPAAGFLTGLRELTRRHGILLIFDEVITGFRVARGGAQELFGIKPDLTCLGKIIGGGLPVGAFGGSAEIMNELSPVGPVYQAGTLSGNPIAMAAGIATLGRLKEPGVYEELDRLARALAEAVDAAAADQVITHRINRVGSMLNLFFTDRRVETFSDVMTCDLDQFSRFFRAMLDEGIYLPPSQFETWFVSLAHGDGEIAATAAALARAFERIK